MKKKLFSHPEAVIATLAIILFSVLVMFYFWATDAIVVQVHRSLVNAAPQNVTGFDLQAAAKLDLRGLLNQSSSAAASEVTSIATVAPVTPPPSAPVVAPTPPPASVPTPTSTAASASVATSTPVAAPATSSTAASSTGQ